MGDIVKMQSVVWTELVDLCLKEQKHAADARALWPDIAARMARLRNDYPSDNEFGAALFTHGVEYNIHNRAAFIWMASLTPQALADALDRCQSRSPRYFRAEVESWADDYFSPAVLLNSKTNAREEQPAESAENATPASESSESAFQKNTETAKPDEQHQWNSRSKLFPLGDDGQLIQNMLAGKNGRSAVYALMPKQKPFLRFIIDQIKAGRLNPPPFNAHYFHAQRLVPALHKSFVKEMMFSRLDEKPDGKACKLFMDHFDDVLRAAELGWTYAEFKRVTKGIAAPTAGEVLPQRVALGFTLPASASLADGTVLTPEPIHVCGQCLYPSEARPDLDYAAAYLYAHLCRDIVNELHGSSVSATGMSIAHYGLWLARQYPAVGGFMSAIGTAIRARGETMDRALWFKLEPYCNRVGE